MNLRKLKFLAFFQNFAFPFLCKSQPQICVNLKPQIPSPVVEKLNNNAILDAAGLQEHADFLQQQLSEEPAITVVGL